MNWRKCRHNAVLIIVVCFILGFWLQTDAKAEQAVSEYQVKAAFLYNFIKFVEWPEDAFPNQDAPIVIGIVGKDSFNGDLDNLVRDKTIRKRAVEVRRLKEGAALNVCHVLFVAQSEAAAVPAMMKQLEAKQVLTVSETPGFLERGGIINFVISNNKVRFEVNIGASADAGLQISSKLLNLAVRVVGKGGDPKK